MTAKHSFVDDYPYLCYSASPNATDEVQTSEIADGAITTAKLADEAVTTAKIADAAVTADKLAQ